MRRVRQYNNPCRSVAQPGSASGLGPEGREFESLHSDHPPLIIGNLARPKLCGWWREKPVAIRRCHSIKRGSPMVHDSGVGFMARARIYKPCKTSMQSGRKAQVTRGNAWVLEYPRSAAVRPEPLMGWQSSADTHGRFVSASPTRTAPSPMPRRAGSNIRSPNRSSAASSRRPMPTISPLRATGPGRTRRHRLSCLTGWLLLDFLYRIRHNALIRPAPSPAVAWQMVP